MSPWYGRFTIFLWVNRTAGPVCWCEVSFGLRDRSEDTNWKIMLIDLGKMVNAYKLRGLMYSGSLREINQLTLSPNSSSQRPCSAWFRKILSIGILTSRLSTSQKIQMGLSYVRSHYSGSTKYFFDELKIRAWRSKGRIIDDEHRVVM